MSEREELLEEALVEYESLFARLDRLEQAVRHLARHVDPPGRRTVSELVEDILAGKEPGQADMDAFVKSGRDATSWPSPKLLDAHSGTAQ